MRLAARLQVHHGRLSDIRTACLRAIGGSGHLHQRAGPCRSGTQAFGGAETQLSPGSAPLGASCPVLNKMPHIRDSITLTPQEQEIFDILLEVERQADLTTVLRCAGGWVRDKLMGLDSLDIDVALDNMMGSDFAERVNTYLKEHGKETHSVAVILSNPEQSKHLETARMRIQGVWVDFVNLRSEEYAHHSRIPTYGTPQQDAERRDFTINSLFYNINTGAVEDFTGRGLDDLRAGIIRTPLPPAETFMDDPLRVLRAVRFASRFGFELEPALLEAASSDPVSSSIAL